jgi:hypothetical protein
LYTDIFRISDCEIRISEFGTRISRMKADYLDDVGAGFTWRNAGVGRRANLGEEAPVDKTETRPVWEGRDRSATSAKGVINDGAAAGAVLNKAAGRKGQHAEK